MASLIEEAIGAVLLPVLGAGGILLAQRLKNLSRDRRSDMMPDVITQIHAIYRIMHAVSTALDADRGLILYVKNGGDPPKISGNVTTTIHYEVLRNEALKFIRDDYQDVKLDEAYAIMLSEVVAKGFWDENIESLDRGFLQDQYREDKVIKAHVFEVLRVPGRYYYGSLQWVEHPGPEERKIPTDAMIDRLVRSNIPKLKSLLEAGH